MSYSYSEKYRPRGRAPVRFGAYEVSEKFFAAKGRCILITTFEGAQPVAIEQRSLVQDHEAKEEWNRACSEARRLAIIDALQEELSHEQK